MKTNKLSILIGYALLLISCTPIAKPSWIARTAEPQNEARDAYECERDARGADFSDVDPYGRRSRNSITRGIADIRESEAREAFYDRCMRLRGWEKITSNR